MLKSSLIEKWYMTLSTSHFFYLSAMFEEPWLSVLSVKWLLYYYILVIAQYVKVLLLLVHCEWLVLMKWFWISRLHRMCSFTLNLLTQCKFILLGNSFPSVGIAYLKFFPVIWNLTSWGVKLPPPFSHSKHEERPTPDYIITTRVQTLSPAASQPGREGGKYTGWEFQERESKWGRDGLSWIIAAGCRVTETLERLSGQFESPGTRGAPVSGPNRGRAVLTESCSRLETHVRTENKHTLLGLAVAASRGKSTFRMSIIMKPRSRSTSSLKNTDG